MGIDIYFKDESLQECKYALCAEHRRTPIEVVYNDTGEEIPHWQFRRIRRTDYKHGDIDLPIDDPLFAYEYAMQKIGEEYPESFPQEMANGLKAIIRQQNKRDILIKKFARWVEQEEFNKLVEWCMRQPDENKRWVETAWYGQLDWNEQRALCRQCPVAPLDEDNCYLRFSNYPSMDYFKAGMMYLIAYAEKYKKRDVGPDPFCFPHVDRKKKETPRDKLIELWEYCAGTKPEKTPEKFFNQAFRLLEKSIEPSKRSKKKLKTTGHEICTEYIPFVDEFLAKCVYRDEFYKPEDAAKLLPLLETLHELGDYAKGEASSREAVFAVDAFQFRLGQLIKALRMARKFNIEFGMSY